jgi:hypothetical protein
MVLEPAAACAFRHWMWQLAPCLHNGALAYQSRLIVDPNDSNSPLQLIRIGPTRGDKQSHEAMMTTTTVLNAVVQHSHLSTFMVHSEYAG